jgi:formylglycine-generating enzyme required for sulfatase activity
MKKPFLAVLFVFFFLTFAAEKPSAEGKIWAGIGIFSGKGSFTDVISSLPDTNNYPGLVRQGSFALFDFLETGDLLRISTEGYRQHPSRGSTAIYEAWNDGLNRQESFLGSVPAELRPALCVNVLITDGIELYDKKHDAFPLLCQRLDTFANDYIPLQRIVIQYTPSGVAANPEVSARLSKLGGGIVYTHDQLYRADSEVSRLLRDINRDARARDITILWYFILDKSGSTSEREGTVESMENAIQMAVAEIFMSRRPPFEASMVFVPGGVTEVGSDNDATARPRHRVMVADFYISNTEITQYTYYFIARRYNMDMEPPDEEHRNFPVSNITWNDAVIWCNALSEYLGRPKYYTIVVEENGAVSVSLNPDPNARNGVRLPDEFEYEIILQRTWRGRASRTEANFDADELLPAASLQPDAMGIYDLRGNILEFCNNDYMTYDGSFTVNHSTNYRKAMRGGSYLNSAEKMVPYWRWWTSPSASFRSSDVGFRYCFYR